MGYAHLTFKADWVLSAETIMQQGECAALIEVLKRAPLTPEFRKELLYITVKKGVLSTTAIEGNSVTESEYDAIVKNQKELPPSRRYQQTEINNMIEAFNYIKDNILKGMRSLINPELIKEFHKLVTKNLGEDVQAVPGRFRNNNVTVGHYRPPESIHIPELINKYCDWLKSFGYGDEEGKVENVIIEAIAAHVYFEWIHPFGDGNGRTGRLMEYYILMRGGLPLIAGHILSNFYNNTRDKYYRMFEICRNRRNLTDFFAYSILGLRDGLRDTYEHICQSHILIFWQRLVYDTFAALNYTKKEAHKRKRTLVLNFPLDKGVKLVDIPFVARVSEYMTMRPITLYKDIRELMELNLLTRGKDKLYYANWQQLCRDYFDPTLSQDK